MMWRVTDLRRTDGEGKNEIRGRKEEEITIGRKGRAVKEDEKKENKKKIHV